MGATAQAVLRPAAAAAAAADSSRDSSSPLLHVGADAKLPLKPLPPGKWRRLLPSFLSVLAATYVAAYATSLQGGAHSRDLAFINSHLNVIGRCLGSAIVCFTVFVWAALRLGRTAWAARGCLAAIHLLFLAYDHGQTFQSHGFYNWFVFLLIAAPVNLVLLGIFQWWRSMKPRQFVTGKPPHKSHAPSPMQPQVGACIRRPPGLISASF